MHLLSNPPESFPVGGGTDGVDPRWILVQRIADSPYFVRTQRLREFLLYACRCALENSTDQLKEHRIGCDVYGRRPDYNPAEDNIVRVQAGLLRKRLADYFEAEGRNEPVVLRMPKGSYVPVFEPRAMKAPPVEPTLTIAEPLPPPASLGAPLQARRFTSWQSVALVLSVVCLALSITLVHRARSPEPVLRTSAIAAPFWSQLFSGEQPTYIVCADAALALFQDLTHSRVSLRDYLDHRYETGLPAKSDLRTMAEALPDKQYTGIADVYFVQRLLLIAGDLGRNTHVRASRSMNIEDFKTGNFILVGSARSTPWTELFEPQLEFYWDFDSDGKPAIRNSHPRPGERPFYRPDATGHNATEAFSIVALLPNVGHTGNVLIVGGTSSIGTQAASEWVTDGRGLEAFLRTLHGPKTPYFEVLLHSGAVAGVPKNSELIAYRVLAP